MTPCGTRVITRSEVRKLMTLERCIAAVEEAFRQHGSGAASRPGILGMHGEGGGFHIKAAFAQDAGLFAAKMNANFPQNPRDFSLPTIQGVIILSDARNGYPLAVIDSTEITILRTAAATAVAARRLARPDSATVTICGCGSQARAQLQAVAEVRPIRKAFAFDIDPARACSFAAQMSSRDGVIVEPAEQLSGATLQSDIIVTCTPAKKYYLTAGDVRPGTFIAAVGADAEDKQELDPVLLAKSKVVADIAEQAATIGDSHHAIACGAMSRKDIHAELGELVAGIKPGRTTCSEITVLDSTGTALQDVAAAALAHREAEKLGFGLTVDLFA
jgi:ornithine cyclodeaminase/alanine dehydrogenase-like protein (mu-crystallin family)